MPVASDRTLLATEPASDEVSETPGSVTSLGLEATVSTGPARSRVGGEPTRGSVVDRYVVIDLAGAGAMGLVLVAYDPKLDRKVAVKLLKIDGSAAQIRLQREAQALAKLVHPNVVGIYDVGTHDGRLFMAMEYVEGQTLGRWMAKLERPRPWRRIVSVFRDAGRGLAAAHEAGLVHRDFKPENVMLGDDGRARVMDFGLARAVSSAPELEVVRAPITDYEVTETDANLALSKTVGSVGDLGGSTAASGALHRVLTKTGAIMGTPAYMSPEQFEGKTADARSDQFSFCVALYEALYGERPFPDSSLAELIGSLQTGTFREPPPGDAIPAWVRRIVLRGLAPKPDERWPSMPALIEALGDDPSARRRSWIVGAVGVAALGTAVFAGVLAGRGQGEVCTGLDAELAGVWDEPRRDAIEAAFAATELSYAPGTWARVEPRIDAWAQAWTDARTEACEATRQGTASAELLDLRVACLDRQLTHLRAFVDVLDDTPLDHAVVENVAGAVAQLPSLDACADTQALLEGGTRRDPETAQAVAELEGRRIAAQTLGYLGRPVEALMLLDALIADAEAIADDALHVDVLLTQGRLQFLAGDHEAARTTLRAAYRAAELAALPDRRRFAASRLVEVTGTAYGLGDVEEGRDWAFHAEALLDAAGTERERAEFLFDRGSVELLAGDFAQARQDYADALAIYESDPSRAGVLEALSHLANAASLSGDAAEAIALYERALAEAEGVLDPNHPDIGVLHQSLGEVLSQIDRDAEALPHLREAVTILERALGPEHPRLGETLSTLGFVLAWQGEHQEARQALERSAAIIEASVGTEHIAYADVSNKRGVLEFLAGDYAAAEDYYQRARAGFVASLGPEHPHVGIVTGNLAEVAQKRGESELALERADRALAILEPKIGEQSVDLLDAIDTRAAALAALGRGDDADATRARASAIRTAAGIPQPDLDAP